MPELPEVEVIRRELTPLVCGKTFARPAVYYRRAIFSPEPEEFSCRLQGRSITGMGRKGKYLLFKLDRGTLLAHLRMTGKLLYGFPGKAMENPTTPERDLRVKLPFTGGDALYFYDMRKFGGFWLLDEQDSSQPAGFSRLGPDIWEQVGEDKFLTLLQARPRARVKPLLLDQHFVAGMGNIYTDESLLEAGSTPQARRLALRKRAGGFTGANPCCPDRGDCLRRHHHRDYRNVYGGSGSFQEMLNVYGRKGEPCFRCSYPVERIVIAGRGTYFCPHCQE